MDGKQLQSQYKDHLSDFQNWDQRAHAQEYILYPKNMGYRLCIDETALSKGDLYTILINRDKRGRKGSIIAVIQGTKTDDIIAVLTKMPQELRNQVKEITLDMTCFFWEEDYYVIWSQRQFLPKDLGAWLYIAKLNPDKPEQLLTKPVILSKPEYVWGNKHTFVDEGPFALQTIEKLYVTFSSAAVDVTYVVGCLEIEKGKNLLDASNWRKYNYPILTARSVPGEYGTGHNAYVMDENGLTWNTYHARPGKEGPRSSGIRRVHFDVDGAPMLDVTEERDVLEEFKRVETVLETAGQEE